MVTLQAALKRGVEQVFQIEESELAVEPLPSSANRKALLFYEAAEGGAGVLTRLAGEKTLLSEVAEQALQIMHYAKEQVTWEDNPPHEVPDSSGKPPCEAGCYRCLLSYFNQMDHEYIDRRDPEVLRILIALTQAEDAVILGYSAAKY